MCARRGSCPHSPLARPSPALLLEGEAERLFSLSSSAPSVCSPSVSEAADILLADESRLEEPKRPHSPSLSPSLSLSLSSRGLRRRPDPERDPSLEAGDRSDALTLDGVGASYLSLSLSLSLSESRCLPLEESRSLSLSLSLSPSRRPRSWWGA